MPHSKTSATRIRAAERRTRALELRKAGKTFRQIGQEMGISEQRAHRIVTQELQRLNAKRAEQAAEVIRLEMERLDTLLAGVWPEAKSGEGPAVDRALAIMNRRSRLVGLDAPERRELTGGRGGPLSIRLEEMSDAELEAIAGAGGEGAAGPAASSPPA